MGVSINISAWLVWKIGVLYEDFLLKTIYLQSQWKQMLQLTMNEVVLTVDNE